MLWDFKILVCHKFNVFDLLSELLWAEAPKNGREQPLDLEPAEVVDGNEVAHNCDLFKLVVMRVEKNKTNHKKAFYQATDLRDHVNESEASSFVVNLHFW